MSSDSVRHDTTSAVDASPGVDRDAKIEQLLLAGLDYYFASQYEQAINIWTRALFLDRNHARARAYIDRARRAQAERQRESEELLHNGVVAYRRGDGREARRLLQAALDAGAPFEDAFSMLERLDQLEAAIPPVLPVARTRSVAEPLPGAAAGSARHQWPSTFALVGTMLLVLTGVAGYMTVSSRGDWGAWSPFAGSRMASSFVPAARETLLAVPTRAELSLAEARNLVSAGNLHAALSALDRVRSTDSQKSEADRLRADIQHQLIRHASDSAAVDDSSQGRRQ